MQKIAGTLGQVGGQVADAGGSIFGIRHGTEEPPFTVARRVGEVEIREYRPRIAAETTVEADEEPARNEGFRRLARYIFGGNTATTKIAMTAPVAQQQGRKIAMTAPVAALRGPGGVSTEGDPVTWFYDPPWTLPFRRRNEVAVKLAAG